MKKSTFLFQIKMCQKWKNFGDQKLIFISLMHDFSKVKVDKQFYVYYCIILNHHARQLSCRGIFCHTNEHQIISIDIK